MFFGVESLDKRAFSAIMGEEREKNGCNYPNCVLFLDYFQLGELVMNWILFWEAFIIVIFLSALYYCNE